MAYSHGLALLLLKMVLVTESGVTLLYALVLVLDKTRANVVECAVPHSIGDQATNKHHVMKWNRKSILTQLDVELTLVTLRVNEDKTLMLQDIGSRLSRKKKLSKPNVEKQSVAYARSQSRCPRMWRHKTQGASGRRNQFPVYKNDMSVLWVAWKMAVNGTSQ